MNNGRAVDFLPWLMPFYERSAACRTMKEASHKVRTFVEESIIEPKRRSLEKGSDFLDSIMGYLDDKESQGILTSQTALFALEDILGGHSAVANIILRILFDIALNKQSALEIRSQIEAVCHDKIGMAISLEDKQRLPWVVAAMHETIRLTCSPIVPHQATQDSTIGGKCYDVHYDLNQAYYRSYSGYAVPKDTVIFVNNHALNMSPDLWTRPEDYEPSRFLDPTSGDFSKPAHFQPFSMGKRSCMGYKMVHNVAFSLVANLMLHFDLSEPACLPESLPLGMLALPSEPFEFTLTATQTPKITRPTAAAFRNFA